MIHLQEPINRISDIQSVTSSEDETYMMSSPVAAQLSQEYIGKWNEVVSRTNWEKGTIILKWRAEMKDLPSTAYSDGAWAKRVGNVSPQHVGRLRRVSERFGTERKKYPQLFWSHFLVALEWDDAEMWLEGASQNDWSVSQMRIKRWEAVGAPEELKPSPEDVIHLEIEDEPNEILSAKKSTVEGKIAEIGANEVIEGFDSSDVPFPLDETGENKRDSKHDSKNEKKSTKKDSIENTEQLDVPTTEELLSSLKDFAGFPNDLADALQLLKVAILNHKLTGWEGVSAAGLLRRLDALKALVHSTDEA